ncbi:hypothetical protein [Cellulomonas sp.]|uniref:hypothetical protein n=1 Tax=Cellulomonas sp. TaxID=40001 RepID=UPI001B0F3829|nr:hypothetical protein [Cellulomonas sp.]MBO9553514.1 hypothetical protein [Cellulomonas sp.]
MSDAPRSEVLDDLYGGAPDDFVARRDAAAKAARAAGDRDLAREIAALRKPTAAAALINALVRDDPGLADRVVTLGDALREAERTFDGRALRDLSRERRALVTGLVARARTLGSAAGQRVGDAVAQEVDQTLTAALADPDIARDVTSGHLAAGREYSGFGGLGGFGLAVADDDAPAGGADDAPAARAAKTGSGGSLRRVPRGRLTVVEDVDEPRDADDERTSTGRAASRGPAEPVATSMRAGTKAGGTTKAGKTKPGKTNDGGTTKAGKTKAGKTKDGKTKDGATTKAGGATTGAGGTTTDAARGSTSAAGRARTGSSATAAERRRRAAETARAAAVDARDRARKAADRATGRRDERRADLDAASQAARAAHDLHDELRTAMTDLRRRIAKADKDAVRAEDRLAKAERALHDEERSAIAAAQDLRRAERALQAADRELDALDDEPPS